MDAGEHIRRAGDCRVGRPSAGALLQDELERRAGPSCKGLGRVRHQRRRVGFAVVEHDDATTGKRRQRVREARDRGFDDAVRTVDLHGHPSTPTVTLRVMPHDGITELCLPGPPTTTTRMLSGCSVIGSG